MRYWEEMRDKYGFNDGGSIPRDAEATRDVYVRVLNVMAEAYRSKFRAEKFDRPGVHNYCLILVKELGQEHEPTKRDEHDEGWSQIMEDVQEMELDNYINSRNQICNGELNKLIKKIKSESSKF
jgi:hypothetical protein